MARHVWSVLCERILVDRETGGVSLIGAVEDLVVNGTIPAGGILEVAVDLALASSWVRAEVDAPERDPTRIRLQAPGGAEVSGPEGEVDLSEEQRVVVVTRLSMIPLHSAGRHTLVLEHRPEGSPGWSTVAEIPVEVKVVEPGGE